MKKLLLVAPVMESPSATWSVHTLPFIQKKAFIAPLHIATIAALTPDEVQVDLWDEAVDGLIDDDTQFEESYDLVGTTGFINQLWRAKEIAEVFRKRGIPVALGGAGVSAIPDTCRGAFDVLFLGEAEMTWPLFIADFLSGSYKSVYRPAEFPDLASCPAPRWGRLGAKMKESYMMGAVQSTRGCPFSCEFCNIWIDFGRKMRAKPVERVLEEIATLEQLGMESILFGVDNFVGKPQYAKELLRALAALNRSFTKPVSFAAEMTLTIASDEEMLSLLADANFTGFLIGLESPNAESLKETRKVQNLRGDLASACRHAMSYGVPIDGSMIVGFDHDTPAIFDQMFDFLQEASIPCPRMHMLKAIPGTELWTRMVREGRLVEPNLSADKVFAKTNYVNAQKDTNILPAGMTREELLLGYARLLERIYDWDSFGARVTRFLSNVTSKPAGSLGMDRPRIPMSVFETLGLSMSERALGVAEALLAHAHETASFLTPRVLTLIIRNYVEAANVPVICEGLERQVELERIVPVRPAPQSLNVQANA